MSVVKAHSERFTVRVAVYLLLVRDGQVLLLRRCGTGFMDGLYMLPAGHLEADETLQQAVIREVREEIGLQFSPEQLALVQLMHRKSPDGLVYLDAVFQAHGWSSEPENLEPRKCDHLAWFPCSALPQNTIPYVADMIQASLERRTYTEHGWIP